MPTKNQSPKIIAVDSGKYATKALYKKDGKAQRLMFATKMDPTSESFSSLRDTYAVSIDGQNFLIGNGAETINYEKSKAKDIHRYATYVAAFNLAEDGDEIILVVGCPLAIFNNVTERGQYAEYMKHGGVVDIVVNGVKKTLNIVDVKVCPESSGVIWRDVSRFENKLIGVVDIGGLNTNACVYDHLAPVKSTSFTNNKGANIMRNELKHAINSNFSETNLQDWQMEDVIQNGFIKSAPDKSREFITNFLGSHIKGILDDCTRKGWDLKNMSVIFVGGGSKLFQREILTAIPDAEISSTAEWDNVEGFYCVGSAVVG